MDLFTSSMFAEACHSVAIEHATTGASLARRVVNQFHERRHPSDMYAAASLDPSGGRT